MYNACTQGGIMAVTTKSERIDIRIRSRDKQLIELAAQNNGLSLSSYIVSVVLKQAKLDLKNINHIILSNEERDAIINAINTDVEPSKELLDLLK